MVLPDYDEDADISNKTPKSKFVVYTVNDKTPSELERPVLVMI